MTRLSFTILLLMLVGCTLQHPVGYRHIENYMRLKAEFDHDTISWGDSVTLYLTFQNLSDTAIEINPNQHLMLYPKNWPSLITPQINLGDSINRYPIKLSARDSFTLYRKLWVSNQQFYNHLPYFNTGTNQFGCFCLYYRHYPPGQNDICGPMESNTIAIVIQPAQ